MRDRRQPLVALAALLACACSSTVQQAAGPELAPTSRGLTVQICDPLGEVHQKELQSSRPTLIAPDKMEGDRLLVIADYAGGCAAHDFKICASEFSDTSPVEVRLEVIHKSEETCGRAVREHMSIDVALLKDLYRRTYRKQAGAILFALRNGELLYQFGQ